MSLDERSTSILTQLYHADSYVPMEEITTKLHVSKRTVYYDINKINDWLQDHGLKPIDYIRATGFYLPEDTKKEVPHFLKKLTPWQYYYSERERLAWLAICLLTEPHPLFLKDLMETIRVSRVTTVKELNRLREELSAFHLHLHFDRKQGYMIEGSENDKRKAVVHYFSEIASTTGISQLVSHIQALLRAGRETTGGITGRHPPAVTEEQLSAVYQTIEQCEDELGIRLTDEMVQNLAIRFILFSQRLAQEKRVVMDEDEKKILKTTSAYQAAQNICKRLGDLFLTSFPDDEICYVAMNILGAKVNSLNPDTSNDDEIRMLRTIIGKMIDDFQLYSCVYFRDRAGLEESMLIHLKPAYYRIKYGLELQNPLTKSIKQKYNELFNLTQKVMHHFEEVVGRNVNDDEIAYIAMHFGGWMKREGAEPVSRKKALIVCGNGISTSRILQAQLENLCTTVDIVSTASVREYESKNYDVDFVISTAPLKKRDVPVFIVSPILTDVEKETLLNQINSLTEQSRKGSTPSVKSLMELIKRHSTVIDENSLAKELQQFLQKSKPTLSVTESAITDLRELLTRKTVHFGQSTDWRDAIRQAAEPLAREGYIGKEYVAAMIANVEQLGPYIVIAPQVAIPHAKPEQGVTRLGLSLLRLDQSVAFSASSKHDVRIIVVLASVDNVSHLRALSQLTAMLSNPENIHSILEADTVDVILQLVEKYSGNDRS